MVENKSIIATLSLLYSKMISDMVGYLIILAWGKIRPAERPWFVEYEYNRIDTGCVTNNKLMCLMLTLALAFVMALKVLTRAACNAAISQKRNAFQISIRLFS